MRAGFLDYLPCCDASTTAAGGCRAELPLGALQELWRFCDHAGSRTKLVLPFKAHRIAAGEDCDDVESTDSENGSDGEARSPRTQQIDSVVGFEFDGVSEFECLTGKAIDCIRDLGLCGPKPELDRFPVFLALLICMLGVSSCRALSVLRGSM